MSFFMFADLKENEFLVCKNTSHQSHDSVNVIISGCHFSISLLYVSTLYHLTLFATRMKYTLFTMAVKWMDKVQLK